MNYNEIIKKVSGIASYIIVAFIGMCISCICCNPHTNFPYIAMTPSITKAVEIQNFIEKQTLNILKIRNNRAMRMFQ